MRIYYFVHLTGRDRGQTGIQRIVRSLGRTLQSFQDVELVPTRWSEQHKAVVHAERLFCDTLALHGGPSFAESKEAGKPIDAAGDWRDFADNWLLVPEVPHLKSGDARYPSVHLGSILGYARTRRLRTAVIFHDLLPLTHSQLVTAREKDRLTTAFIAYGQSLANADLALPNSWTSARDLLDWLRRQGFRQEQLPRIKPVRLPYEIPGIAQRQPSSRQRSNSAEALKFFTLGTVCLRKNQLRAMEAFNRVRLRHPDQAMEFHVIGHIDPELAGSIARQVARANGSIVMHGFLPDEKMVEVTADARASVFVSLAEGFGLPIAESLWLGIPCLCSNFGAMAEVASGGGCLTVDSRNLAEIEAGLEQIAFDDEHHQKLLAQLETRKLRTWREYASDIRDQLCENGEEIETDVAEILSQWVDSQPPSPLVKELLLQLESSDPAQQREFASEVRGHLGSTDGTASLSRWMEDRYSAQQSTAAPRSFHIDLKTLKYHDDYLKRGKAPIFDQEIIRYRREDFSGFFKKIREPHLFYGPYIRLDAGRYMFSIDGEVKGPITIKFVKDHGTVIAKATLTTLAETLSFDLPDPAANFEIVGEKTDQTEALEIRSIFVEFVPPG